MTKGSSTPLFLQMEAAECGAACLAMVLAHHGKWITLEEARERCGTSRDGVDAAGLIEAANSYGLSAAAFRQEPEALSEMPMPQVLHWRFNHFVVLEAVTPSGFHIIDPAKGRRTVKAQEFGDCFTGLVIAFEPSETFQTGGRRPSVMASLVREAMQSRDALAISFVVGLAGVVPALALTGAVGTFIDHVLGGRQTSWISPLLTVLFAVIVVKALLALLHKRVVATWKIKIGAVTALRGFWRSLTLPLAYFAQRSAGEVVSRIRLGSDVGSTVAGPLADLMPQITLALGYLLILGFFDPIIMLAAFVAAMLNLTGLTLMTRALADRTRESQIAEGIAAGVATSGLANIATYRMLGREQLLLSRWTAAEDQALDAEQRLGFWRSLTQLGPVASGLLLSLVALVVGAFRAVDGTLSLGDLVAVQMLAGLLNAPVAALANGLCQIQEATGALMRLADLEDHPQAKAFVTPARTDEPPSVFDALDMSQVGFGYSAGAPLLHDIDLKLEPGRLVAVLGPSGAGKSTLARLAAGLLEPTAGSVKLGGIPLNAYPNDVLRSKLVYVQQANDCFSGTIEQNMTLWDDTFSPSDVRAAAERAGLADALAQRAGGMNSKLIGGASTLSGGEMQRLVLARALLRKPVLLVLDETTSALDNASEEDVLELLRDSGAAVLIVTHRVGTAMRCDEAILVRGGTIVARGTPQDVLDDHTAEEARAA